MANIEMLTYSQEEEDVNYNELDSIQIVDALLRYFIIHTEKGLPFPYFDHPEALDYLDEFALIKYKGESRKSIAYITPLGRQVSVMGFSKFIHDRTAKLHTDAERQRLNDEKLLYDVKNSKRVFKTYWWTFFFAVVSFAYVIFQIIMKLIELSYPK